MVWYFIIKLTIKILPIIHSLFTIQFILELIKNGYLLKYLFFFDCIFRINKCFHILFFMMWTFKGRRGVISWILLSTSTSCRWIRYCLFGRCLYSTHPITFLIDLKKILGFIIRIRVDLICSIHLLNGGLYNFLLFFIQIMSLMLMNY